MWSINVIEFGDISTLQFGVSSFHVHMLHFFFGQSKKNIFTLFGLYRSELSGGIVTVLESLRGAEFSENIVSIDTLKKNKILFPNVIMMTWG